RFPPHETAFAKWVGGIAMNVLRHQLRSRARYRRRVEPLGSIDVAAKADDHHRAERVAAALEKLPPRYEEVLRAKYLDRQTVEEIAAATGDTVKATESVLSRAREAFRVQYESES
ncbi:MAG: sigma-70 family RNA polymerase sigma factor, partial [Gemmataceae bacterium]